MSIRPRGLGPTMSTAFAALLMGASAAAAHPHVFAEATMEIVADKTGHLEKLHNAWWMDELFSSSVIVDFDKNANGKLDKGELAAIGKQVASSIQEWSFYTFVHRGADLVALKAPPTLDVVYDETRRKLRFSFDMRPSKPLDLEGGTTTFSAFDNTYFVAFDFAGASSFVAKGLPRDCHGDMSTPSPDEAAKSWMATISALGTNDTVPEDGIKFSEVLSTKFKIACGAG